VIAVDTSALIAIVQNEPAAEQCVVAIESADRLLISAATFAEALIVAARRNVAAEMGSIFTRIAFEITPVTSAFARDVAGAYGQWGKGVHPAGLNFGDCFAYAIATSNNCPLLYIGNDFAKTDVTSAINP
jgi:ribonuclease VapC